MNVNDNAAQLRAIEQQGQLDATNGRPRSDQPGWPRKKVEAYVKGYIRGLREKGFIK